jgi:hypothetical protein
MSKLLLDYIRSGVEPIRDSIYGNGYRCSVHLTDGTYLPCVILRNGGPVTDLALRRFEEEKKGKGIFRNNDAYKRIVAHFLTSGNRVNAYDIERVEPSRFAIPLRLLSQIHGETTMSWTAFVLEMRDGMKLAFGTTFLFEFFNLPQPYTYNDVVAVHNHAYVSKTGELMQLRHGFTEQPTDYDRAAVHREMPYFVCYADVVPPNG